MPGALGGISVIPNRHFTGTIDDVRIYKRALTADEVTLLSSGEELGSR